MEKNEAARILYLSGKSGKEIATLLRLREATVSNWNKKGGWEEKRTMQSVMKQNSSQRIMALIDYQTEALEHRVMAYREGGDFPLIERGDIDALQKLYSTIKKDARKWADYVTVLKEYSSYLQGRDLELAQSVLESMDDFLNEKRKTL